MTNSSQTLTEILFSYDVPLKSVAILTTIYFDYSHLKTRKKQILYIKSPDQ